MPAIAEHHAFFCRDRKFIRFKFCAFVRPVTERRLLRFTATAPKIVAWFKLHRNGHNCLLILKMAYSSAGKNDKGFGWGALDTNCR